MNLECKSAVVTGASRVVGRATALALAKRGCSVLINYSRSRVEAERTAEQARELGAKALCHPGDVSDDRVCREMMDVAVQSFGRLDILVNNAGTTKFIQHSNLDAVTDALWDQIFGVNLKGPFQCARAARKYLEASGEGVVINVASVAGVTGMGSSIPYCASKAAVINLTLSLARALAPKVRVNAVAPGFIAGQWTQEGYGDNYETVKKSVESRSALGKVCQPEDVADAILSLITGSTAITGRNDHLRRGFLIGPKV